MSATARLSPLWRRLTARSLGLPVLAVAGLLGPQAWPDLLQRLTVSALPAGAAIGPWLGRQPGPLGRGRGAQRTPNGLAP